MGDIRILYEDKYEFVAHTDNVDEALDFVFNQYRKFSILNPDEYIYDKVLRRQLDRSKAKLMISSVSIHENISMRDKIETTKT